MFDVVEGLAAGSSCEIQREIYFALADIETNDVSRGIPTINVWKFASGEKYFHNNLHVPRIIA